MAVTVDELLIKIELSQKDTANELSRINKELTNLNKTSEKTADGVGGLSANFAKFGVAAFAAIKGAQGLIDTIASASLEFMQAEDAIIRLNTALELTGAQNIPQLVDSYKSLGDELESFGVTSTETVLKLAKIGVAAGQTTEETQKLIKVAADLSVAREIPLEMAFKSLSATLKGSAGQLAAIFPELQNFSQEQLKAGDAVNYLSLQLSGFSQTNLQTYAGQLEVIKARMSDVREEFGKIAVESGNAAGAFSKTTLFLEALTDALRSNSSFLTDIISGLLKIADLLTSVMGSSLVQAVSLATRALSGFIVGIGYLQKSISLLIPGTTKLGDTIVQFGKDLYSTGSELQSFVVDIAKAGTMFPDAVDRTSGSLSNLKGNLDAAKKAQEELTASMMTPEQRQALEALKNKVIELEKAQKTAGKTGLDLIYAQAEASKAEINAIKQRISGSKELNGENKKLYDSAIAYIEAQKQAQINAELLKTNEEAVGKILDQYKNLGSEIAKQTMTQREFIDYQLEKELERLDILKETAAFQSGEAQDLLNATKERLKVEAEERKKNSPKQAKDYWNDISKTISNIKMPDLSMGGISDLGSQLTDAGMAIGSGIAAGGSAILGYVVMAIDIIKAAPDFLKSAFLELPGILLDALTQIPAILDQIIRDFPAIIQDFASKLPGLLIDIVKKLPDFIIMLAEQLPFVIEKIAEAIPEIIVTIIKNIPKLLAAIMKSSVNQILGFIKGIAKGIGDLLSGKKINLGKMVDTKGMEDKIKKLSGETGRIFSVENLMEAAQSPVNAVMDAIDNGMKKGADYLMQAWNWINDNIIKPIGMALTKAWQWIYQNIIQPIGQIITQAWQWVYNNIVMPLYNGIRDAWLWVYNNVIKPIFNIVTSAFTWVNENIIKPIADVITGAWSWVQDNIIAPMADLGRKIAAPFEDAIRSAGNFFKSIGDAFSALFKLDFEGLKNAVSEAFGAAGEALKNVFRAIMNPFVDIFNGLIQAINSLKIPEIGWSISAGSLGKWSGTLIPEIDLIPGELNKIPRFADGGLVGVNGVTLPGFGTDTVPAMLTPGEFVMNRRAVENNGLGLLSAMNSGKEVGGNTYQVAFEINIDAKTTMDEGYIRGTLVPRMQEELKRASLDGKFVLSSRGIR